MNTRTRKLVYPLVFLVVIITSWQIFEYRAFTQAPLQIPENGARIEVPQGSSLKAISRKLDNDGIITIVENLIIVLLFKHTFR